MNIFFLDRDPKTAAQLHCDKHVVKMILESAQILCTAHRLLDGNQKTIKAYRLAKKIPAIKEYNKKVWQLDNELHDNLFYGVTHRHHPCVIWVMDDAAHYDWLYKLFIELGIEYTNRYGKGHKTIEKLAAYLNKPPVNIKDAQWTDPPKCVSDQHRDIEDVVDAYKEYYRIDKYRIAKWKHGNRPAWMDEIEVVCE